MVSFVPSVILTSAWTRKRFDPFRNNGAMNAVAAGAKRLSEIAIHDVPVASITKKWVLIHEPDASRCLADLRYSHRCSVHFDSTAGRVGIASAPIVSPRIGGQ